MIYFKKLKFLIRVVSVKDYPNYKHIDTNINTLGPIFI